MTKTSATVSAPSSDFILSMVSLAMESDREEEKRGASKRGASKRPAPRPLFSSPFDQFHLVSLANRG